MAEILDGPSNASFNAFNASSLSWSTPSKCSKVPGSDPGTCLLEKLMIILLSQHNTISAVKIKYNFFN